MSDDDVENLELNDTHTGQATLPLSFALWLLDSTPTIGDWWPRGKSR